MALGYRGSVHFGIRELTYELSLFDHDGRVAAGRGRPDAAPCSAQRLVDVRHEAIKRTAEGLGRASLTAAGEALPGGAHRPPTSR